MSATQYAGPREEVKEARTGSPPITGNDFTTGGVVGVTCVGLQTRPTHESCSARRLRPPETTGRGGAGLIACGTTVSIRATVIFPDLFPVVLRDWLGFCEAVTRQSRVFTRLTLTQPASRRDVCPGVRPYSVMGALDPFKIADGGQYSVGLRNSMLVPLLVGWWVDPSTLCPTGWWVEGFAVTLGTRPSHNYRQETRLGHL